MTHEEAKVAELEAEVKRLHRELKAAVTLIEKPAIVQWGWSELSGYSYYLRGTAVGQTIAEVIAAEAAKEE